MEPETRRKIGDAVVDVLRTGSLYDLTEFKVRAAASERVGIDLSAAVHRDFVRGVVECFLMSTEAPPEEAPPEEAELNAKKEATEDGERVICKLSNRRNVVIHDFRGKTLVSFREFYKKDGKKLPSARGISLPAEEWTSFKKSVPAIEEAIRKMETKLRCDLNSKRTGDRKQPGVANRAENSKQIEDSRRAEDGKQIDNATQTEGMSNLPNAVAHEFFTIETCRFNGKNYPIWAQQMELLLNQMKIGYVLFISCPVITLGPEASTEEIAHAKAAENQWVNDDFMCRRSILNALSDDLFTLYSRKATTAKELWGDLKQMHLYEQFGMKRSLVKKYIEFEMHEGKPVLEQIQEFNDIADSIVASGTVVEEKFHVGAIISKLPPSWKDVCIKLMSEEHLPFKVLMDRLKFEEELRTREKQGLPSTSVGNPPEKPISKMRDPKPRNMQWKRPAQETDGRVICSFCGRKGHISPNCYNKRKFDKNVSGKNQQEKSDQVVNGKNQDGKSDKDFFERTDKDVNDKNREGNGSVPMDVNMLEGTVNG